MGPSFRLAPESTRRDFSVIPAQAGIYALRLFRHSGASRNLRAAVFPVIPAQAGIYAPRLFPSFRRKPASTRCDFSVIPAQAGIYALRFSRHSGASRHLRAAIISVIPAQAGIYALRRTPVFARATGPHLNHLKRNAAKPPHRNRRRQHCAEITRAFPYNPPHRQPLLEGSYDHH